MATGDVTDNEIADKIAGIVSTKLKRFEICWIYWHSQKKSSEISKERYTLEKGTNCLMNID